MIYSHYITDKAELEVVVRDVYIRCRGVVEMKNWWRGRCRMGWNIDSRRKLDQVQTELPGPGEE